MMGLSLGHIIILLIVVILFGPKRVGELGGHLGRSLKGLRDSLDDAKKTTGLDTFSDSIKNVREEAQAFKDSVNPLKSAEKQPDPVTPASIHDPQSDKKPTNS